MVVTRQGSWERSVEERLRKPARALTQLLALVLAVVGSREASAEVVQLTPGVDATAISCAPSGNGTGHMVCLEYERGGTLIGVSWQAPPTANGQTGSEPIGTLQHFTLQPQAPVTPVGAPGCAPVFDGGTITCLVVTQDSSGFSLLGVSFYPPNNTLTKMPQTQAELQLVQAPIAPATAKIGTPTCAFAGGTPPPPKSPPVQNVFAICAVAVNQQLYAIAFAPQLQKTTAFTPLGLEGVVSNPSCDSVQNNSAIAVCAVRQQGGLTGFFLNYDPDNNAVDIATSMPLSTQSFTGDPSCAAVSNGVGNCGILSGNILMGAYVDPAVNPMPVLSLGVSPDKGAWSGLGCSQLEDFRGLNVKNPLNANLSACAVVSSSGKVFEVSFDPQKGPKGRTLGILGSFASGVTGSPSCFKLAIDNDQLYCGALTTNGPAFGMNMPVGLLSPSASAALGVLLSGP